MANSIKFDSTEIRTTTYVPRFVKHESAPERVITQIELSREDGNVLVAAKYSVKKIALQGILIGSTQADLESKIDAFKELISRKEKNLDIEWNGATMRYVATCTGQEFDRDHFNILHVPWTIEFTVFSGEGKDTTTTTPANDNNIAFTSPNYANADTFDMAGSKPARPVITITGANWPTGCKGIEYKNTDTGEKIVITRNKTWGNTDKIIIDCLLKLVSENLNSAVYNYGQFYGVFPQFKIGTNAIRLQAGAIVCQETSENGDFTYVNSGYHMSATTHKLAQSFTVPYKDETFSGVTLLLSKQGSPGILDWRIETDNNGVPSGTLAHANAYGGGQPISSSVHYERMMAGDGATTLFTLNANTKYWIVLNTEATVDAGNYYNWNLSPDMPALYNPYTKGNGLIYIASWAAITPATSSFGFKLLYGGFVNTGNAKHKVEYVKTYL